MNPQNFRPVESAFGPGAQGWEPGLPPDPGQFPRTALPVRNGHPRHLGAHGHRLTAGAAALGLAVPWLEAALEELAAWLVGHAGVDRALRLTLEPGPGLLRARLEPLPQSASPYGLVPLPHPLGDLRSAPLARHKGLSGWGWRETLATAEALGGVDALLFWPDGTVAETAIATVALETQGTLFLPPESGRVASVTERLDLPAWAELRGLRLQSAPFPPEARGQFWCLNALRGIWPALVL